MSDYLSAVVSGAAQGMVVIVMIAGGLVAVAAGVFAVRLLIGLTIDGIIRGLEAAEEFIHRLTGGK